ncbi:MAG: helix-turn-helix domain-containing protein [Rheinheimera sp.]|nr:helix-turn-helix domain-containing protein [Rheinheimera sp.]
MQEWLNRIIFDYSSPLTRQGNEHKFGYRVHKPDVMPHSHWHGHIEVNFLFDCSAVYLMNGRAVAIPAGRMVLFWASIPHQLTSSSGDGYMVNIYIPLQAFQQWKLPSEFIGALLRGEVLVADLAHASDVTMTQLWDQDLALKNEALTAQVISEIRGRIRRMALESYQCLGTEDKVQPKAQKNPVTGLSHIDTMLRYIADHYDQKVTISDVAAATGLHPNYAMKLFHRVMKISIKQYINRLRLLHAQALLVDTEQGVLTIAIEAGFGSISRFYDIFQQELKMTPQQYRDRTQKIRA